MLKPERIPTPLYDPAGRSPILLLPVPPLLRAPVLTFLARVYGFLLWLLFRRITRRSDAAEAGRRLRGVLEGLGPFWVKTGQLMALRHDLFPLAFCAELLELQYAATGFPAEVARSILEKELGRPIDEVFDVFQDAPIAAASIAQVHRARLRKEGVWVVVKVQRPDVVERFRRYLRFIEMMASLMMRLRILLYLRWDEALWELEQIFLEETDYRYEASNLRRMKRTLKGHGVYVPTLYEEYSTERVLTMEFVGGVLMSDFIRASRSEPARLSSWCRENDVDSRKVGETLALSYFQQLLEDNLMHGDLHPGNIMLLRGSRVALIDFGTIGTLESELLRKYVLLIRATADKDYSKAVEMTLLMADSLPQADLSRVKERMVRAYLEWEARSSLREIAYEKRSIANAGAEVAQVMMAAKIAGSWAFMKMSRSWVTLDASLAYLTPGIDYGRFFRKYFQEAFRRRVRRLRKEGALAAAGRLVSTFSETAFFQGSLLRRQAQVFQGVQNKVSFVLASFFAALRWVAGLALVVAVVSILRTQLPRLATRVPIPVLDRAADAIPTSPVEVGIGLALLAFAFFRAFGSLERRFKQPDVETAGRS